MKTSISFSLLIIAIFASTSWAYQDESEKPAGDLKSSLGELIAASPKQYDELIEQIATDHSDLEALTEVMGTIAPKVSEQRAKKLVAGWSQWTATDAAGTERPYQIYLPKSVAKENKTASALIVHMHGGVNRPEFGTGLGRPQAVGYANTLWANISESQDIVVVAPQAKAECAWWTDNGVSHLQAVLRDARRSIKVPDESIFGAGFSDGASGCFYLAMATPDPFAGFVALNGHPAVASGASQKQLYLQNLTSTPLVVGMTQEDSLYPSSKVLPHITAAIASGADIHLFSYPKINHQPLYFGEQIPAITNFIKTTKRNVAATQGFWTAADESLGKSGWVEILKIGPRENDTEALQDVNLLTSPGRVRFGVTFKQPNDGEPEIAQVVENSAAGSGGVQIGDTIIEFDGRQIENINQAVASIRTKSFGDAYTAKVKRGEKEIKISGIFPKFVPRKTYRRNAPTAHVACALIDGATPRLAIKSRNVSRLRLWLPNALADRDEIAVAHNGEKRSLPITKLTAKEYLERFATTADQADNRYSYIEIE